MSWLNARIAPSRNCSSRDHISANDRPAPEKTSRGKGSRSDPVDDDPIESAHQFGGAQGAARRTCGTAIFAVGFLARPLGPHSLQFSRRE
jgi:hypothetical protein